MRNKLNVLITGHSGMLGKDILNVFKAKGAFVYGYDKIENTDLSINEQFIGDLNNKHSLLKALKISKPDIIIYTAAIVNLELCENEREQANEVHIEAAEFIVKNKKSNAKFIYISTDSVFDGTKGNYKEDETPNPINYYSLSKYKGEKRVMLGTNITVIRTNIYGMNKPLKNSLAEWAIKKLIAQESIVGFDDVIFNGIYTKDLAEILYCITGCEIYGIVNVACKGYWSKYEFLLALADQLELDKTLIQKGTSISFDFRVPRPLKTHLDITKIDEIIKMPTLTESLKNFCNDFKKIVL